MPSRAVAIAVMSVRPLWLLAAPPLRVGASPTVSLVRTATAIAGGFEAGDAPVLADLGEAVLQQLPPDTGFLARRGNTDVGEVPVRHQRSVLGKGGVRGRCSRQAGGSLRTKNSGQLP